LFVVEPSSHIVHLLTKIAVNGDLDDEQHVHASLMGTRSLYHAGEEPVYPLTHKSARGFSVYRSTPLWSHLRARVVDAQIGNTDSG